METLACGHVAYPGGSRLCPHLLGVPEDADAPHVRLLTGTGLDYDMCCQDCDLRLAAGGTVELAEACEGCVVRIEDEARYGELLAWRGSPGIAERPEPCDPTLTITSLPEELRHACDLAPVSTEHGPAWLVLSPDGKISRLDVGSGRWSVLAHAQVPDEPDHQPFADHDLRLRLYASPAGEFAAAVHDYGRHGQLIDLRTGRVILDLDGGGYRPNTVPFSFAFAQHQGRTVVVHRTDWNRLDVCDAATGRPLTARTLASYQQGESPPAHSLDYFHGALHASPGGRWLADDGWVWHPVGAPTVWDLRRWLGEYIWESEDGPSLRHLCSRAYHWDVPMCWIADDLLAVSGIGYDDELMLDGVRIFNAGSGEEVSAFAGPRGRFFADHRRLYAAAPAGLEIWDARTGERTGTIPDFSPTHHHPAAGELVALRDGTLLRWSTGHVAITDQ